MGNFRWYKDMFLLRIYIFKDCNARHWKEMFIDGLPSFMAERVYNSLNKAYPEQIPWENLTYAQLTSKIIECGLDICNEIKIQTKVQKHSNLHKKEMKTFCFQYGFEKVKEPVYLQEKFVQKTMI